MTYIKRPTIIEDVYELAFNIRQDDRQELIAAGLDVASAISFSVTYSDEATTHLMDDEVVCIMGVRKESVLGDKACPWLLTAQAIEKYPIKFIKESKLVVEEWLSRYPILENYVDSRYKRALKWAEHVGFNIEYPVPYGPYGLPFNKIVARRDTWEL